ncbi:hypothetical protein Asp14428_37750 [Actinoplanes sp. NBRC 14428]|nr:hypothetical protein Asp14428_37750 [Actinoplanes sp. NBRC 14428]
MGDVGGFDLGCHASEVEGGDAVGDGEDVVHVVGDEDDAEAVVGEAADEFEDLGGLGDAEGGGGFVEDDDAAVPEDGFGDGDGLALAAGEAGDELAQAFDGAYGEAGEGVAGHLFHGGFVEGDAAGFFAAEEHVLDDVEVVAEGEVLVDDFDAEGGGVAGGVDGDLVAVEGDRAGVDGVDAADAFDEGGFSGAVVADQGGDFAGVDGESDVVQDLDGTEAFVDPA